MLKLVGTEMPFAQVYARIVVQNVLVRIDIFGDFACSTFAL